MMRLGTTGYSYAWHRRRPRPDGPALNPNDVDGEAIRRVRDRLEENGTGAFRELYEGDAFGQLVRCWLIDSSGDEEYAYLNACDVGWTLDKIELNVNEVTYAPTERGGRVKSPRRDGRNVEGFAGRLRGDRDAWLRIWQTELKAYDMIEVGTRLAGLPPEHLLRGAQPGGLGCYPMNPVGLNGALLDEADEHFAARRRIYDAALGRDVLVGLCAALGPGEPTLHGWATAMLAPHLRLDLERLGDRSYIKGVSGVLVELLGFVNVEAPGKPSNLLRILREHGSPQLREPPPES